MNTKKVAGITAILLVVLLVAAMGGAAAWVANTDLDNEPPTFMVNESLVSQYYDGLSDGLLTAGLGLEGLSDEEPPGFDDNFAPRVDELRENAIYYNYRSLQDTSEGGGFGRLFGPNVLPDGSTPEYGITIAGWEYIAYADADDYDNVTMMVQIPDSFDPDQPCIVTGPSSGSRGVYGAVGIAGEWGLRRGCAVAYTDKGTGVGIHDLSRHTVTTMRGKRIDADAPDAAARSNFTAAISEAERRDYTEAHPNRFAFKHAHSENNVEAQWGRHVLNAVEFAFWVLNQRFGTDLPLGYTVNRITPENTLVIGIGISNGGGATLRAAEEDAAGLLDAIVVSEPTTHIGDGSGYDIAQGGKAVSAHSKELYDYYTFQNLYQPCASIHQSLAGAPFNYFASLMKSLGQARCAALKQKGLLQADTAQAQAAEAQRKINDYGFLEAQNAVAPSHMSLDVYPNVAINYGVAYGRFSVTDNLCGYSFAALDGNKPAQIDRDKLKTAFSFANGIPPTASVHFIYERGANSPIKHVAAVSESTGLPDMALDGALCLRALAIGEDPVTGEPLTGDMLEQHRRIQAGIKALANSGNLRGRPAIIVNGRADAVLPPNHNARAYYATNQTRHGQQSQLRYYELTNVQHLDAFLQFPGYSTRFVPIHYYLTEALDMMWGHLTNGRALPPSQVVRPTPRKQGEPLEQGHLPGFAASPGGDAIGFSGSTLQIPE